MRKPEARKKPEAEGCLRPRCRPADRSPRAAFRPARAGYDPHEGPSFGEPIPKAGARTQMKPFLSPSLPLILAPLLSLVACGPEDKHGLFQEPSGATMGTSAGNAGAQSSNAGREAPAAIAGEGGRSGASGSAGDASTVGGTLSLGGASAGVSGLSGAGVSGAHGAASGGPGGGASGGGTAGVAGAAPSSSGGGIGGSAGASTGGAAGNNARCPTNEPSSSMACNGKPRATGSLLHVRRAGVHLHPRKVELSRGFLQFRRGTRSARKPRAVGSSSYFEDEPRASSESDSRGSLPLYEPDSGGFSERNAVDDFILGYDEIGDAVVQERGKSELQISVLQRSDTSLRIVLGEVQDTG